MLLMMLMYSWLMPYLWSEVRSACGWILSKAFSQSRKREWSGSPCASAFSMSLLTMWIGCEVDLFALKPNWVVLSLESMAFSNRVWSILDAREPFALPIYRNPWEYLSNPSGFMGTTTRIHRVSLGGTSRKGIPWVNLWEFHRNPEEFIENP